MSTSDWCGECNSCAKLRRCECRRLCCDVVGGTCEWQMARNEKDKLSCMCEKCNDNESVTSDKTFVINGGDCLDKWVERNYGDNCSWVLKSSANDIDGNVVEELSDFVVIDDNGNKVVGIVIYKRESDGDESEDDMVGKLVGGDKFIGFTYDDLDVRCWEFEDEGYIAESDYDCLVKCGKHEYIAFIEKHKDFKGWHEKCEACHSNVENCSRSCKCNDCKGETDSSKYLIKYNIKYNINACN